MIASAAIVAEEDKNETEPSTGAGSLYHFDEKQVEVETDAASGAALD